MTLSQLSLPVLTVNGYLWDTLKQIEPTFEKKYGSKIPFFPLSDAASGTKSWETKTYVIYDRMIRRNRRSFYPIKNEHILYYVKGREVDSLEWGLAIQIILDRMDDAAQDINEWNRNQANPAGVYFHHLKVYQTDSGEMGSPMETRDFSTRPFYITRFIVEAEYHFTDSFESLLSS
jgi:hypothetical protein